MGAGEPFDLPPLASCANYGADPAVWDVIIVGGGVAGAALAYAQGKAGRRVLLLERDLTQPDRIVGELLQPGGYLMLKKLGLASCVDGIDSQKVYGYALMKNGKDAVVEYPMEGYSEDVAGRSFHHGRCAARRGGGGDVAPPPPPAACGGRGGGTPPRPAPRPRRRRDRGRRWRTPPRRVQRPRRRRRRPPGAAIAG